MTYEELDRLLADYVGKVAGRTNVTDEEIKLYHLELDAYRQRAELYMHNAAMQLQRYQVDMSDQYRAQSKSLAD